MWLASTIPRVIVRPPDPARALALAAALEALGLHAEALDDASLEAASDGIRHARTLRFGELGVAFPPLPEDPSAKAETDADTVGWGDVATLVRAVSRGNVIRSTVSIEKVPMGRGGATIDVVRESTREEHPKGELLYVFAFDGRAWLLGLDTIRYATIGMPLRPTQRDNFLAVVERLRAGATRARYDDELVRQGPPRNDVSRVRGQEDVAPVRPGAALDLAARLIHRARMRALQHPYRTKA